MAISFEKLPEILEVHPDTIRYWEVVLGLHIKGNQENKVYSEEIIEFFKKVKNLSDSGFGIEDIKEILAFEIDYHNNGNLWKYSDIISSINDNSGFVDDLKENLNLTDNTNSGQNTPGTSNPQSRNTYYFDEIIVQNPEGKKSYTEYETKDTSGNNVDIMNLFEMVLKELKQYTDRIIEAEKKIYLLEDTERRVKEKYFEINSEIKQLKALIEEKDNQLKEFEDQKKKINFLEVQLRLLQLNKKRKKFLEFWK